MYSNISIMQPEVFLIFVLLFSNVSAADFGEKGAFRVSVSVYIENMENLFK